MCMKVFSGRSTTFCIIDIEAVEVVEVVRISSETKSMMSALFDGSDKEGIPR